MFLNFNEYNQFMLSCNEKRSCKPFGFTNVSVAIDGDEEAQLSEVPLSSASIRLDKNYIEVKNQVVAFYIILYPKT